MKRVVSIQDISCLGKCSLTVALPIISAMGVETCVVPTAVLSTHTGGFSGFTFHDLTQEVAPIAAHWKKEGITFDAIYTGYLGSFEQIELVGQFFDQFGGKDTLVYVDPAMADNGVLYTGFTPEFAKEMGKLCGKADVIVPNLTEASFMLGVDYVGDQYDEAYIKDLLKQLTGLGCKTAVLTGMSFEPGKIGAMAYDSSTDTYASYFNEKLPVQFHGTGDIFASACVGALMNGKDLAGALKVAVDYTLECIRETQNDPDARWYGVNFESAIPMLVHSLGR
ncbi:MAG: pyridoxamine kinase [Clostridiales bacterium]|nr:pyridoxamine kinase [Clostridiales bacterium]